MVLRHLVELRRTEGLPVAWLSANPKPLDQGGQYYHGFPFKLASMVRCPATDHRYPHLLAEYNRVAAELASQHQVDFIDVWQPVLDLHDLSFDGTHFQMPVAAPIADAVLEWLETQLNGDETRTHLGSRQESS